MRPSAVAVDFGHNTHSPDDEYEHVTYPHPVTDDQLPLYHSSMAEEKARRRVRGPALHDNYSNSKEHFHSGYYDDDEGKDVYNKLNRNIKPHIASGRIPQPPPPPPTSIVCLTAFSPLYY